MHSERGRFRANVTLPSLAVAGTLERMRVDISSVLVADLQRRCELELGHKLTLAEAEQLGRRMLVTFELLFDIHQRELVPRSTQVAKLTKTATNETLLSSRPYAQR